jgi:hypothetical protein
MKKGVTVRYPLDVERNVLGLDSDFLLKKGFELV